MRAGGSHSVRQGRPGASHASREICVRAKLTLIDGVLVTLRLCEPDRRGRCAEDHFASQSVTCNSEEN
jgi:hypothetical protein